MHTVSGSYYVPSCDEDGYYRKVQCDQSRGECWCVDQHGVELMRTRIHGSPDCGETDSSEVLNASYPSNTSQKLVSLTRVFVIVLSDEVVGYSGDFGSGVGWEDEEENQEDTGEEAEEEEEEEESEADDGGYIW